MLSNKISLLSTLLVCTVLLADLKTEKEEFVYDLSLATQGIIVSQFNTGVNYSLGFGIHQDIEKSIYWYQEATKQGHSKAPFNLAIIYAEGKYTPKDLRLAESYFLLSAERGNIQAKDFLKRIYTSNLKNSATAIEKLCCPKALLHAKTFPLKK